MARRQGLQGVGRALCAGLLPVALSACISGPAPVDHFYRLEAAAPGAPLAAPLLAGVLEVDRPRADALVVQLPLLYRDADATEVGRHPYHRWADAPNTQIQNELARFLREAGVAEQVVIPEMRVDPEFVLGGRLARLERVLGGGPPRVVVELELSLTRKGGGLLLLETYREERPAGSPSVGDAVAAFDEAVTRIFERFLADLNTIRA